MGLVGRFRSTLSEFVRAFARKRGAGEHAASEAADAAAETGGIAASWAIAKAEQPIYELEKIKAETARIFAETQKIEAEAKKLLASALVDEAVASKTLADARRTDAETVKLILEVLERESGPLLAEMIQKYNCLGVDIKGDLVTILVGLEGRIADGRSLAERQRDDRGA